MLCLRCKSRQGTGLNRQRTKFLSKTLEWDFAVSSLNNLKFETVNILQIIVINCKTVINNARKGYNISCAKNKDNVECKPLKLVLIIHLPVVVFKCKQLHLLWTWGRRPTADAVGLQLPWYKFRSQQQALQLRYGITNLRLCVIYSWIWIMKCWKFYCKKTTTMI